METKQRDPAIERLADELADVAASIALVSSGTASGVTLTGLRFGRQVADRLRAEASREGVDLRTSFRPDESACDVLVSRSDATRPAPDARTARV